MEFQYTLQREDYLDYCKYQIYQDPSTRKLQRRCWLVLPVVLAILLIGFRPASPLWYVLAAAAAVLWVLLVNILVGRIIQRGAQDRCGKLEEKNFQSIHLDITDGGLKINGKGKKLRNYLIFSDSVFLMLKDDSVAILPARVFGRGEGAFRSLLEALRQCMEEKKGAKV